MSEEAKVLKGYSALDPKKHGMGGLIKGIIKERDQDAEAEAHSVGRELVDQVLQDDPVGHSGDRKHAAARERILDADDSAELAVAKPTVN